jgi:hypothetical protein
MDQGVVIFGYKMRFELFLLMALDCSGCYGGSWDMDFVLWSLWLELRTWKFGIGFFTFCDTNVGGSLMVFVLANRLSDLRYLELC